MKSPKWGSNSHIDTIIRIPIDPADLTPAPETVARYLGGAGYKLTPKTRKRVREGIGQALAMIHPLTEYRVVSVDRIDNEFAARLPAGDCGCAPFDFRQVPNRYFVVYLATLGPALETACRELAHRDKIYRAMILDAVGTAMLDALGQLIERTVYSNARSMGFYAGCRMGPGLNGMALENQALLFGLLDSETVGVHLNASYVMQPSKSISAFIPLSKSEQKSTDGDKCTRCNMKDCQFREKP